MKVKEIMTPNPVYVTVGTSLHDAAHLMLKRNCGCLPVTENDENLKPIGMITDRDITTRTVAHNKNPLHMVAGEVMTDHVISVTPETDVEECIEKMEKNQIRRLAVVDREGNLCGMLAQADLARYAPKSEVAELVRDISMETYDEAVRSREASQAF